MLNDGGMPFSWNNYFLVRPIFDVVGVELPNVLDAFVFC